MLLHHYSVRQYFSLTTSFGNNGFFSFNFFCVSIEFTSICKAKSDEESHEEEPFINQNVELNAVSREQGKHSTRDMNMYFFLV